MLDVSPVEPLAGLDEIEIVAFEFPSFYRFLFAVLFTELVGHICDQLYHPGKMILRATHAKQLLAEPTVHFEMRIPQTALDIGLAGGIEVKE